MDQEMNEDKAPVCPNCGSCHCGGCSGDAPSVPAADAAAECPAEKEPAPTYEEVREAYDRLVKLVEAYGDQAILQLVINHGEDGDFLHICSPSTFNASGKSSRLFAWGAARGYMMRARQCLNRNAEAIGEGVKYLILESREEKKDPLAALLGVLSGNN